MESVNVDGLDNFQVDYEGEISPVTIHVNTTSVESIETSSGPYACLSEDQNAQETIVESFPNAPASCDVQISPLEAFASINRCPSLSTTQVHSDCLPSSDTNESIDNFSSNGDVIVERSPDAQQCPLDTAGDQLTQEVGECGLSTTIFLPPNWMHHSPRMVAFAEKDYHCSRPYNSSDNYLRGCLWSPDGSCILTNSRDNTLRLFNLPASLFSPSDADQANPEDMHAVLTMREIELVYDYTWYPLMNSANPSTCCFASSVRRNPIRLWDAFTGTVRATYRPISHLGELISPYSVAFSSDGLRLYAGFNRFIHVFDVGRPGSDSVRRPKLGKKQFQGGMISCIAVPRDSSRQIYATGSYNGVVAMFSEPGHLIGRVQGSPNGVTQVMFSARLAKETGAPWYLVAGGRMDSRIFLWDARSLSDPLLTLHRRVENHQRFQFDIDHTGQYLFTGSQTGVVCVYDLAQSLSDYNATGLARPGMLWRAHSDSANGLSVNPALPVVATASGQRRIHFPVYHRSSAESSAGSSSSENLSDSEEDFAHLTDDEASIMPSFDPSENLVAPLPFTGKLTRLPCENRLALWLFPTVKSDSLCTE